MDTRELLTLLNERVQQFQFFDGGIREITEEDIARALGDIRNPGVSLLARVKYNGQYKFTETLALEIRRHIMLRKLDNSWRIPRHDFLLDLSILMIMDDVDLKTCKACRGVSEAVINNRKVRCPRCSGLGRKEWSESYRARLLGISPQSWANTWSERYYEAKTETVDRWDCEIPGVLKRRIWGE